MISNSSLTPGFFPTDQTIPGFFATDQIIPFMTIIKPGIKSKIDSILEFRRNMASAGIDTPQDEAIYTNSQIHEDEKSKFEQRFSFRRTSLLPPPLPSKEGVTTLDRVTGTKPKIPKTPMTPTTPMIDHP